MITHGNACTTYEFAISFILEARLLMSQYAQQSGVTLQNIPSIRTAAKGWAYV